jgi:GNAT superfamily N-acetyltransferase
MMSSHTVWSVNLRPVEVAADSGHCSTMSAMTSRIVTGETDVSLNRRLSDELDIFNAAAAHGPSAVELTVKCVDADDELLGGISGWTWQQAAGIGKNWVRADQRGSGVGSRLLAQFEQTAADRGARRIFVTSFTFQAPGFYEKHGYREIFRWDGLPLDRQADVHFRKDL